MNYVEIFWNNIASLVLIPTVIIIVLKLKNVQIDSLREQNNVLKEQARLLGLFRISEVEKEIEAMKKFYERRKKEADKAKKKLDKTIKELENVKSLSKREIEEVVRVFQYAIGYVANLAPHMASTQVYALARQFYFVKGPIGEAWREHWDGGQIWRSVLEDKRKKKKEGKNR